MKITINDLKLACLTAINSAALTRENHSNDNSFIDNAASNICSKLSLLNLEPIGFCYNIPYNHYVTDQIGFVFKDNDEIYWVHFPLLSYEVLLKDLFGDENVTNITKSIKNGINYIEEI